MLFQNTHNYVFQKYPSAIPEYPGVIPKYLSVIPKYPGVIREYQGAERLQLSVITNLSQHRPGRHS